MINSLADLSKIRPEKPKQPEKDKIKYEPLPGYMVDFVNYYANKKTNADLSDFIQMRYKSFIERRNSDD